MGAPAIQYARSGMASLAWMVEGEGPLNLVFLPGAITNVELLREHPRPAALFDRLASFSRLVLYDRRGMGQSDPAGPVGDQLSREDQLAGRPVDLGGAARAQGAGAGRRLPLEELLPPAGRLGPLQHLAVGGVGLQRRGEGVDLERGVAPARARPPADLAAGRGEHPRGDGARP